VICGYDRTRAGELFPSEAVLTKLRASLKKRGAEGIRGLSRHFKIVDRDKSGSIDADEFANLCRINNLGLSASDQAVLMRGFDSDGSGTVDYEEFLKGVRGRLSPTRKKMVRTIFDALDKVGGELGYLTIKSIENVYSVSNHPEVRAGKKSKEEVLQEFLNGFEGKEGNRDGKVTFDEWLKYYEEVSVSIDSDDYFGQMLASTWAHIKRKAANGATEPVLKFTPQADVTRLEGLLRKYMYSKTVNDQNTKRVVENAFKSFDTNGSGNVDFDEFVAALERFGLHTTGRRPGVGGLPIEVVRTLFDKYDSDSSGSLDYKEFVNGLFADDDKLAAASSRPAPPDSQKVPKAHPCEQTKYLKESNHIFGPRARD